MKYLLLVIFGIFANHAIIYGQTTPTDSLNVNDTLVADTAAYDPDSLILYNFISPNGDGVNDFFVIEAVNMYPKLSFELIIYNVWGNMVYRKRDYQNEFEGKANVPMVLIGKELPDGVYYYTVIDPILKKHTGKLTIKR